MNSTEIQALLDEASRQLQAIGTITSYSHDSRDSRQGAAMLVSQTFQLKIQGEILLRLMEISEGLEFDRGQSR